MSGSSPLRSLISRYKRGLLVLIMLVASSFMILFNGTPGVMKPQEIGLSVFSFFQGLVSQTSYFVQHAFDSMTESMDVKNKYQEAKKKLVKYEGMEREVVNLQDELKRVREQLAFKDQLPFSNVPAQIIAKDPTKIFAAFTINKGYFDGIRQNMPVVAYQKDTYGLIGKVMEVGLSSSTVQPVMDGNMFISARFINSRYEGLVSGRGNNEESLRMLYVKKTAQSEIHFGDLVVTTGLDSIYPGGLFLGRVKAINSREIESSLEIELEPVITISRLEYVNVIKVEQ